MAKISISSLTNMALQDAGKAAPAPSTAPKKAPSTTPAAPGSAKAPSATKPLQGQEARPTDEERSAVMKMQQLISAFGNGILERVPSMEGDAAESARQLALSITHTGDSSGNPFDGKWGSNTSKALSELKKYNDKINPGRDFRTVLPDAVIAAAKHNIDQIISLMNESNLSDKIPEGVVQRPQFFDITLPTLSKDTIFERPSQGVVVTPSDLDSISKFYTFIKSNYLSIGMDKDPSKTAGSIIADLIKLSQEAAAVKLDEEIQQDLTSDKFTYAIEWFLKRANAVYRHILNAYQSGESREVDGKFVPVYSEADVKNAKDYFDSVTKIYLNWQQQKQDHPSGQPISTKLKQYDLEKLHGSNYKEKVQQSISNQTQQATQNQQTQDVSGKNTYDVFEVKKDFPNGIFGSDGGLDTRMFFKYINTQATEWFRENVAGVYFNFNDIRRMSPQEISNNFKKKKDRHPIGFARSFTYFLIDILKDMYSEWEESAADFISTLKPDDQITQKRKLREQANIKEAWIRMLTQKLNDARRASVPLNPNR